MILFFYPDDESLATKIAKELDCDMGQLTIRRFPDSESYLKLETDIKGREVAIVCSLHHPDDKALTLMFFSKLVREFGARRVGLIAPYLGYMRQDKRFNTGEAITSVMFAQFISQHFDWLVTVDSHLHRYKSLNEIYSIPSKTIHSDKVIADWIKNNVDNPLLVGPDEESIALISTIARHTNAPFVIMEKVRHGDREVEITFPLMEAYKQSSPVLIDDVISTGQTMIKIVHRLVKYGMKNSVCMGVHGLFVDNSYEELKLAGALQIVTTNTIPHPSNAIDVSKLIAEAVSLKWQTT